MMCEPTRASPNDAYSTAVESSILPRTTCLGFIMVLLGVAEGDTEADARWMADKLIGLRVFEDEAGKMNRSLQDTDGAMLVVSQFTLLGDCRKGRRPSFVGAAAPEIANELYEHFVARVAEAGITTATGRFRTEMKVSLTNEGPVTLVIESPVK